ncbi:MAG: hypothetical protein F4X25_00685 [Chloroflexi bacterium]|nr:hypothetical protein [Chloroflexota bacterium]
MRAGERGATAVRRLLRALPDRLRSSGRQLLLSEPARGAAAGYAYGREHAILAHAIEAGRPAAGWARVIGTRVETQWGIKQNPPPRPKGKGVCGGRRV